MTRSAKAPAVNFSTQSTSFPVRKMPLQEFEASYDTDHSILTDHFMFACTIAFEGPVNMSAQGRVRKRASVRDRDKEVFFDISRRKLPLVYANLSHRGRGEAQKCKASTYTASAQHSKGLICRRIDSRTHERSRAFSTYFFHASHLCTNHPLPLLCYYLLPSLAAFAYPPLSSAVVHHL